jgi:uracil-DNA glycosylase
MKNLNFEGLRREIAHHASNKAYLDQGWNPLFLASPKSKIVIIGQAPGLKAQTSGVAWDDASGLRLMDWLGVNEAQFRDASLFAHIPMDFYYPGKGKSGDMPPRKNFAPMWHNRLLQHMPQIQLTILIGAYAQRYYLPQNKFTTLTETVRNYHMFLPDYFPIVHPSPLNFRWHAKNAWFVQNLVPKLQNTVAKIIAT